MAILVKLSLPGNVGNWTICRFQGRNSITGFLEGGYGYDENI